MAEVNKTLIIKRDGLKVVRLELNAGASVPEHSTNAHVVVIPIKGQGTFTIGKTPHSVSAGEVLEMNPNVPHAIDARTDLGLVVVHMVLAPDAHHANCNC